MASSARIDELRKKFDENPRRYFAPLANEYRKVGDFGQAIFICQEYLPQQPGHMSGHIVFGQALFEAKRLPEARTVFETALTLDPENLIALRHLGDISRDLGETTAARGWYERVLQADPRNEEIAAIMSSMPAPGAPAGSPVAPTAETPIPAPVAAAPRPAAPKGAPASASAPTMEISAAAVQDMLRLRQAGQQTETPSAERLTLDETTTVEVNAVPESSTLEGFETTSHEGLLEVPSGGMLGLEPTTAQSPTPEPATAAALAGLEALTLDDFSLPTATSASPVAASAAATLPSAEGEPAGGLLDFDSFGLGGGTPAAAPAPISPTMEIAIPVLDTPAAAPVDAGQDAVSDFEFDIPVAPPAQAPAPLENAPTMIMDAVQDAVPAMVDIVEAVVPTVVDAVVTGPTVIMEAIRIDPPKAVEPPVVAEEPAIVAEKPESLAPTQQMDVANVMEQIETTREAKSEPGVPAERPAAAFVTETMAQLYLEQGHRAEAIEIYRQLVAARPSDTDLRGRLEAIERGSGSRAPRTMEVPAALPTSAPAHEPAAVAAATTRRFAASGPTIRTVLRELFGIDSQSTNGNGEASGSGQSEIGSIDILFSAESVTDALGPLAAAFDGGYVAPSGSIDAVFGADSR